MALALVQRFLPYPHYTAQHSTSPYLRYPGILIRVENIVRYRYY